MDFSAIFDHKVGQSGVEWRKSQKRLISGEGELDAFRHSRPQAG
jgi:hypothetical protein